MSKPRIVFLGQIPPPYMGPSLATEIILESELGQRFDLIHLDTSHHKELTTLGVMGASNVLAALKHYWMLLRVLVVKKPVMVYIPICQTTIGYLRDSVFILISSLFRKKIVSHLRGGNFRRWYESTGPLTKAYIRFVHSFVDIQIVLGENLRKLFDGLVDHDRIYVVPNGRDFSWPGIMSAGNPDGGKTRVLYLSNFIKTKGVLDVLHSVPLVMNQCSNVEFVLAGAWFDNDVKEEIQDTVRQHPEYPVTIAGKVSGEEKLALIKSADLFVLPTYYPPEGHPWSIVEAMAAGLPVISTDQGAIKESVIDGVNGYLVEKQNYHDLSEKIIRLCVDTDLRSRMSRESRRLYEKEFTEARMVERMSVAFNAALSD